jgi:serine/threonine-protein kinase
MTLARGTSIGPYEVTDQIGAGGMGEVYRATDPALGREVAIKVLPSVFAQDANRLSRFEREAKTLASVNHTNIAAIYGLEKWQGTYALVMELVDGLTLADRIALGPIPTDEALPIARQLAEALEVAHERGIVHRDFKPANIKIRPDGTVKVLDFGLAKATELAMVSGSGSNSPTITTPAMTQAGLILGTAAYMSPEQARGGTVDKRADIWAFGVVLYEMLAGRRLFDEPSVSETVAAVLKGELTLEGLPVETPSTVKRLIARCLTRDWRRRLRDIGEARIAIDEAIAHPDDDAESGTAHRESSRVPTWRRVVPWAIASIAIIGAAVLFAWAPWRAASSRPAVTRVTGDFGADITLAPAGSINVALSPDGRQLVLVGSPKPGDRARLYLRRLDELLASPIPGTDGAHNPFFSPDGRWIGFFADGKLKKIPVTGGAAVALADAPDDRGGSWAENGWIAFSPRSGEWPLYRVSSDGGTAEPLTKLAAGEVTHRWPHVLPGGAAVLYTASKATGDYEDADIVVRSIGSGDTRIVHHGGYRASYLPTGHLIYVSQGKLFAAPFDLERFELRGQASPVLSDFASTPGTGAVQLSFSRDGSFVYVPGTSDASSSSIYWMHRDGSTQPLRAAPTVYRNGLRFSPDGGRLALSIVNQQSDIWVYDWGRDGMARLTSHPSIDIDPVWTPDGRRITFRSARDGIDNIYWQRVDSDDQPQRLTQSKISQFPMSWHPSGRVLAFREIGGETGSDIWMLPMQGDEASGWKPGKPTVFLSSKFEELDAAFSPDGRWLAYQSDESGEAQVYVRSFPGPGGRVQVSTAGGSMPQWSRNGKELFFASDNQAIMIASYRVQGDMFHADKPVVWAKGQFTSYDVHPDGQRIAIVRASESRSPTTSGKLVFVFNFFEEINRVVSLTDR